MSNNALNSKSCPPLMSDGRFGTDYRPSCHVHDMINKRNDIKNAHQQRLFLQRNAVKMMQYNTQKFVDSMACKGQFYHVDPNGHDRYWSAYKNTLLKR